MTWKWDSEFESATPFPTHGIDSIYTHAELHVKCTVMLQVVQVQTRQKVGTTLIFLYTIHISMFYIDIVHCNIRFQIICVTIKYSS